MRLKTIVLAATLSVAATAPACAGTGFYVGLGAGWDSQNNVDLSGLRPPFTSGQVVNNDGLIIAGTLGFKLPEFPVRFEFESSYDWHSASSINLGGTTYSATGHDNIAGELFNAIYDLPVAPGWNLYAGGGVGPGHVHFVPTLSGTGEQLADIEHWAFMWQLIGGASFEIAPDAEVFLDYRYRDARARGTLQTSFGLLDAGPTTENVVMAGVRFYMFSPYAEGTAP
jgi:opacity protein-like surface antigen